MWGSGRLGTDAVVEAWGLGRRGRCSEEPARPLACRVALFGQGPCVCVCVFLYVCEPWLVQQVGTLARTQHMRQGIKQVLRGWRPVV